jgi:bifunctional ADP-heptose synthase (sugar kinase/adenylyltransferase)
MRDKKNKIESLMKKFAMQQNIKDVVATQGVTGSLLYNKKNNHFNYCQAFAKNAIDKVGAGDSMLSLIALCLKSKFDKNLAMLISSLGAAQSVKSIGNKEALNKIKIFKAISHLLK